jgi:hypothetical protein
MKKTLIVLLSLILLKGLVWSLFIPLWHFPDEQAHFNHIAFNVETPHLINPHQGQDLNQEIALSEQLLGTFRDSQGNNRFTYHPEFNLDYSHSQQGIEEEKIKTLPLTDRYTLVARENASYPEAYYNFSAPIYRLLYHQDLFVRVFAIRLFWLFLLGLIVYSAYQLAWLLKPNRLFSLTAATLTAFQPMLTFVSSGVTSDNLYNALYNLLILLSAQLLVKFSFKKLILMAIISGIGFNTKPQFLTSLVISLPAIIISLYQFRRKINRQFWLIGLPAVLILVYCFGGQALLLQLKKSWLQGILIPYFAQKDQILLPDYSLFDHLVWTAKHTFREVVPWYWGVFRWLSLALPRWMNQVFNRLMLVSFAGLIIYLFKQLKLRKLTQELKVFFFILYAAAAYFVILLVWDWDFFRSHNFSFGIQGRYYFATIISHMVMLTLGVYQLASLFKKLTRPILVILSLGFIAFNQLAFYHLANSYYDMSSLNLFINQASQYKPWFAKGLFLETVLVAYGIFLVVYIFQLITRLRLKDE